MLWVVADCYFSDNIKRNQQLIEKWNEKVQVDDDVYILGIFYKGDKKENFKNLLNQLNGKKIIIDYNDKNYNIGKEELKSYGLKVYSNLIFDVISNNIFLITDKEIVERIENNYYGAAAKSLTNFNKVWENNILCLSYEYWGNAPINCDEIPQIIQNMIEFDNLEVNE